MSLEIPNVISYYGQKVLKSVNIEINSQQQKSFIVIYYQQKTELQKY